MKKPEAEIEVLLIEIQAKKHILFSSEGSGMSGPGKTTAWQDKAVNSNSKWFDIQLEAKS